MSAFNFTNNFEKFEITLSEQDHITQYESILKKYLKG
jgi:hypothetical protein